jgi:hypothetical protein
VVLRQAVDCQPEGLRHAWIVHWLCLDRMAQAKSYSPEFVECAN